MCIRFCDIAEGAAFIFNGYRWIKCGQQAYTATLPSVYAFQATDFVLPA